MGFRRRSSVASSINDFLRDIPKRLSIISIKSRRSSGTDDQLPRFLRSKETATPAIFYIRDKVLEEVQKIPGNIHPKDIEYFKMSNDMIVRYLNDYAVAHVKESMEKICDQVSQNILETLKWRKSFGLNEIQETDFPREFYDMLRLFSYVGNDNHLYIYVPCNHVAAMGEWIPVANKFLLYALSLHISHASQTTGKDLCDLKPIFIINASGVGVDQLDLSFAVKVISTVVSHFPGIFHREWVFGLPWYLKSFFWLCLKFLPLHLQRKIKIMDLDSATKETDIQNLPKSIGGLHDNGHTYTPDSTITLEDAAKQNAISDKEVIRLKKHVKNMRK